MRQSAKGDATANQPHRPTSPSHLVDPTATNPIRRYYQPVRSRDPRVVEGISAFWSRMKRQNVYRRTLSKFGVQEMTGFNKHAAFTLVEMLVTISVLLILATLLGVTLSNARRKAEGTECLSNLKQHGVALHSFLADQSVYPLVLNPGWRLGINVDHYSSIWAALGKHGLGPMTEEKKGVHVCPSAATQVTPSDAEQRHITGYAYNVFGMGRRLKDEPLGLAGMMKAEQVFVVPVPESAVVNPAGMIAMGDGARGWNQTYEDGVGFISRTPDAKEWPGSHARVQRRHDRKLVILFADGHVSAVILKRLFEDQDDAALNIWNRDNQPHRERID